MDAVTLAFVGIARPAQMVAAGEFLSRELLLTMLGLAVSPKAERHRVGRRSPELT